MVPARKLYLINFIIIYSIFYFVLILFNFIMVIVDIMIFKLK